MNPVIDPFPATDPSKKGHRTMLIALILISVTLAGIAQITLKSGVNDVIATQRDTLHLNVAGLKALLVSPVVLGGLVLFGLSAVVWLFALSRTQLSFAYPFAALSYVFIVAFSVFVLHEHVPPLRWAGVGLIVSGIVVVALTHPA